MALNYKARDKMIWGHVRNLTIFVFRLVQDTLVVLNMTFKIFYVTECTDFKAVKLSFPKLKISTKIYMLPNIIISQPRKVIE